MFFVQTWKVFFSEVWINITDPLMGPLERPTLL